MPSFGFVGPSFTPYSISMDSQRTVNLYPEKVESGRGKNDYALVGTPGLANLLTIMIAAIAGGGAGYTVNDVLTVSGGVGTAATLQVTVVAAGVITAIKVLTGGFYTTFPGNPVSVTGGTGAGATFTLTFADAIKSLFYESTAGRTFAVARFTNGSSRLVVRGRMSLMVGYLRSGVANPF